MTSPHHRIILWLRTRDRAAQRKLLLRIVQLEGERTALEQEVKAARKSHRNASAPRKRLRDTTHQALREGLKR